MGIVAFTRMWYTKNSNFKLKAISTLCDYKMQDFNNPPKDEWDPTLPCTDIININL